MQVGSPLEYYIILVNMTRPRPIYTHNGKYGSGHAITHEIATAKVFGIFMTEVP